MNRKEMFSEIISRISDMTDIRGDIIISSCRREDVVDARYVLVYLLRKAGFYSHAISIKIRKTTRCVNEILMNYAERERQRRYMREMRESIEKDLGMR